MSKGGLTDFLVLIKQLFVQVGGGWGEGCVFALAPLTSRPAFKDWCLQKNVFVIRNYVSVQVECQP